MAEYIPKDAVLKALEKSLIFCENEFDVGEYRNGCIAAIKDDIANVRHIPAADVVPVVHGRWVNIGIDEFMCSKCSVVYEYPSRKCGYNYCPNCGADMRGGNDE